MLTIEAKRETAAGHPLEQTLRISLIRIHDDFVTVARSRQVGIKPKLYILAIEATLFNMHSYYLDD